MRQRSIGRRGGDAVGHDLRVAPLRAPHLFHSASGTPTNLKCPGSAPPERGRAADSLRQGVGLRRPPCAMITLMLALLTVVMISGKCGVMRVRNARRPQLAAVADLCCASSARVALVQHQNVLTMQVCRFRSLAGCGAVPPPPPPPLPLQLAGATPHDGLLQVQWDDQLRKVSAAGFDSTAAAVACRQLGWLGGVALFSAADAADAACHSFEGCAAGGACPDAVLRNSSAGLSDCGTSCRTLRPCVGAVELHCTPGRGEFACVGRTLPALLLASRLYGSVLLHTTFALEGVHSSSLLHPPRCTSPSADPPAVPVRLAGGRSEREGRVEVYMGGAWGRASNLSAAAAGVLCRQLGLGGSGRASDVPLFAPPAEGLVWLAGPHCWGFEGSLLECAGGRGAGAAPSAQVSCTDDGERFCWAERGRLEGGGRGSAGSAGSVLLLLHLPATCQPTHPAAGQPPTPTLRLANASTAGGVSSGVVQMLLHGGWRALDLSTDFDVVAGGWGVGVAAGRRPLMHALVQAIIFCHSALQHSRGCRRCAALLQPPRCASSWAC